MNLDGSFFLQLSPSLLEEISVEPIIVILLVNRCRQVVESVERVSFRNSRSVDTDHLPIDDNRATAVPSKWR